MSRACVVVFRVADGKSGRLRMGVRNISGTGGKGISQAFKVTQISEAELRTCCYEDCMEVKIIACCYYRVYSRIEVR